MKRAFFFLFLLVFSSSIYSFPVYFKEQYFKLYHIHYVQYPDDSIENIYFLEQAKKADFCNPLYALAKIDDKKQWERYRYLFNLHITLKLIEQHLYLGSKWDKRIAYFYNAPWKDQNLESLKIAEQCYRTALSYWEEAIEYSKQANTIRWINLEEIQIWEDESFRIENGTLDYKAIILDELSRLEQVRKTFEAMDAKTY